MSRAAELGRVLFKFRSVTPLPVVGAILGVLIWERGVPPPGGAPVEILLMALGLACCAGGQGLRGWVLGQVRDGTSGQGNRLEAVALNSSGPYAHVRNPLYVGNFFICLGLALMAGSATAAAIGLGFFAFEYAFIVPAEESFLREQFGARYDDYCAQVPRWLWRLRASNPEPLSTTFDWRRALKKEHNPMAAWMSGALALLALKAWLRSGSASLDLLLELAVLEGLLLAGYLGIKGWKHGWWTAGRGRQGA